VGPLPLADLPGEVEQAERTRPDAREIYRVCELRGRE
jgi:hypothetical protein